MNENNEIAILAPASGEVIALSKTSDPIFSKGAMGQGFGLTPSDGEVVAPISGKVSMIADTKHAIGITMKDGSSLLIHCGIDTVNMAGEGFETFVEVDQEVKKGDLLLTFDTDLVKEKGYSTETMMAFELKEGRTLEMKYTGESDGQDVVAIIR